MTNTAAHKALAQALRQEYEDQMKMGRPEEAKRVLAERDRLILEGNKS